MFYQISYPMRCFRIPHLLSPTRPRLTDLTYRLSPIPHPPSPISSSPVLDVTHTGMVYKGDDGSTGLLHASTSGGVKISPDLEDYVQGMKSQTGIIVARALGGRKR